ncbi:PEP-CTERM/exosortase system-associated acyltransferase [Methylococcus sp. EFPC2]|uniref:PEP-CTERM/exosortase system-associated acyltransferase n=1 Tax=Methylococcus sp. EFPC2 TaxID=2812648 RepID=UPI0019688DC9|nr:PEP-CTERM/exosortase system-associated acyltransferase [Methylococcus sp. EFPC2]QSA95686.1 PEP-CTERM/exosortase system-associated acyltransferase [Methylococcus sp. EFPC2]
MNSHENGYDIVLADTPESKRIHFKLRYDVYCLEKGYEEAKKFVDQLEVDEYDDTSAHFLIRCRATQSWIGTYRIVFNRFNELPLSKHASIYPEHIPTHGGISAEFSRLAILRRFQVPKNGAITDAQFECHILMKAIHSGISYSRQKGAMDVVFFCQRSLGRVVDKLGLVVKQIGPKSQYRGSRYPYLGRLNDFQNGFTSEIALQCFKQHGTYYHYSDYFHPRVMAA